MEEARGLSFGITISTIISQAEEDIQHLMGMLGRLRAEAAGDVDIIADTEQASENIHDLTDDIGRLQSDADSTEIVVDADTEPAEENVRNLTGSIGGLGERSADIDIDVNTEQAQTDVQDLEDRVTNFGHDPPDIEIDVDTGEAERNIGKLGASFEEAGQNARNFSEDANGLRQTISQQESELRQLKESYVNLVLSEQSSSQETETLAEQIGKLGSELQDNRTRLKNAEDAADQLADSLANVGGVAGNLEDNADGIGSAFRKSFLTGIDSGNSFSSSLRSGVGGAITHIGERVTDFKDNVVTKMGDVKESVVSRAHSIKEGFAHPIETIKNGLGGAIDHAKSRFTDFVRGAGEAAEAADDVGDAAGGARPEVEDLGDAAEKSGSKFEKLGDILGGFGKAALAAVTAATVAVGGFAAASVNTGMAFDSSMSQVAATMGYSVAELNDATSEASQNFSQLREFAMEMGANTAFSASQAADALNYMALAGYDAETSMTMLPNVLNLAAAGGIELSHASDMVTDAQSALGLSLSETSELVDKMAAASSKSNTSVQQLGDAILTVGGTAKNLSGGTTELSMALGVLADNGIKGAEGGTALRNMILSLSAPTDKAAAALQSLGVDAFDAEGNLRPLNETFGDLNGALSNLTQEQQTQALNEIFNKVDLKSVNAMLGTSAERFEELGAAINGAWVNMGSLSESLSDVGLDLTAMQGNLGKLGISEKAFSDILKTSGGNAEQFADALLGAADAGTSQAEIIAALGGNLEDLQTAFDNTTGAAQAMADTQLDNLAGDITLFKSALEGAQIVISDELSPSLREFTQFGTEAVTKLSEAFQEGGLTGAMGALGGILSDGLGMIVGMLPTAIDAGMQLLGALGQGLLDNTPLVIDAAIQIVTLLGDGILNSLPVLVGAGMQIVASLASGIGGMLPTLIPSMVETVMLMAGALIENLPLVIDAGMQLVSGLADGIVGAVPVLIGQLPVLIDQILGFLTESLPAILEQGAAILTSLADGLIGAVPLLVEMLPEIITSICGFVTENLPTILEQGVQILTTLATGIIGALPELIGQIPAIITGIVGTLTENFPEIVSTGVTLLLELGSGIISAIPQLVAQLPAVGAAILGAFGEIPGMVIDVGKSIVEGLWGGISSMGSWVADKVKGFAGGIVDGIKGFLGIHSPSTVFAEIGGNMALGLGGGFTDSMKGVTEDIKEAIPTNLDGPEIDIPEPNGPPDMTYGVYPNVEDYDLPGNGGTTSYRISPVIEGIDEIGNTVEDAVYKVSPVIEDIKTPPVSDLTYTVNPLVEDLVQPTAPDISYSVNPEYQAANPPAVPDVFYGVKPEVDRLNQPAAEDLRYRVSPDVEPLNQPNVHDLSYHVNPLVEEFDQPKPSDLSYTVHPKVEEYDLPGSMSYNVTPVIGSLDMPEISDVSYGIHPVVDDIRTSPVSDIYYNVNPLVEDFNPAGYTEDGETGDGEAGQSEHVSGNGGAPELDDGSAGNNGGGSTFAPTVTVQITVEGNADNEALEEMRAQLMAEFEAKMRELYDEFREEELQRAALKNQYAF